MVEPVDYSRLFADARTFLTELSENNTRDWFAANKSRYDKKLKRPAEKLLADVTPWLAELTGAEPRGKLFRPHRDLRFTEDKAPYTTHLHMMWSLRDGRAWLLGISPDYATAGAGVMTFEKTQLERWRAGVAGDDGAALQCMLDAAGWRLNPPELKRVPQPYPADHPRADLLRHKGLVAWQDGLEEALTADPLGTIKACYTEFQPLMTALERLL